MVTMRAVADLAGVSTATVSHVINDTRAVSAPTTARVRDAMQQLDYHPDVVARSLRRRETLTIGLLMPSVGIPFYASVAESVEAAATAAGYSIILCNSDWTLRHELLHLRNLLARRVDGLLCTSLAVTADHLTPFLRRGTPVVQFERSVPGLAIDAVEIDNFQGAYDVTAHLIALGHHRIGCVTGLPNSTLNDSRVRGFRQALDAAGIAFEPDLVCTGDYSAADGVRYAQALLDLPDPPSAVFAINDLMAMGVMQAAQARGLNIPADLAVAGFDGLALTAYTAPPLTTVEQPVGEMANTAVAILLQRIRGAVTGGAQTKTFPAKLVVRASTAGFGRGAGSCIRR